MGWIDIWSRPFMEQGQNQTLREKIGHCQWLRGHFSDCREGLESQLQAQFKEI